MGPCWYVFGANLALACVVGVVLVSDVCKLIAVVCASLLGLSWGHVGVHVGASWGYILRLCCGLFAYVGQSWDYVSHSWVLCWAIYSLSWGHLGTILRCVSVLSLCWPFLGLCWEFLSAILGHVGPVFVCLAASCAMQQLDFLILSPPKNNLFGLAWG